MTIEVINTKVDKLAVEGGLKCKCCDRVAEEGKGRIFFMGYWICHECEDKCDPNLPKCSITGHERTIL